jgi:hypothetical protein
MCGGGGGGRLAYLKLQRMIKTLADGGRRPVTYTRVQPMGYFCSYNTSVAHAQKGSTRCTAHPRPFGQWRQWPAHAVTGSLWPFPPVNVFYKLPATDVIRRGRVDNDELTVIMANVGIKYVCRQG